MLRDLGNEFYLLKFNNDANYAKVLLGGPWFIGQHFITIRRWELKFCASIALCSYTVIWDGNLGSFARFTSGIL